MAIIWSCGTILDETIEREAFCVKLISLLQWQSEFNPLYQSFFSKVIPPKVSDFENLF